MNTPQDYNHFCSEWLDSWSGNQPGKLLAFYTDDAFYLDPANPDGLRGRDEMKSYFEKLLARNPEWRWTAEEIIPTEKGFTLKWKAVLWARETKLKLYGLDIVELNGSKISRNEVYFDRAPWLELLKR